MKLDLVMNITIKLLGVVSIVAAIGGCGGDRDIVENSDDLTSVLSRVSGSPTASPIPSPSALSTPSIAISLCESIEGAVFISDTLEDLGIELADGEELFHWRAKFEGGSLELLHSSQNSTGTYVCENDVLTVQIDEGEPQILEFSDDLSTFMFNPLGDDLITYRKLERGDDIGLLCTTLKYRTFMDRVIEPPVALDSITDQPIYTLRFGGVNSVTLQLGDDEIINGIYDCQGDEFHIHQSREDDRPLLLEIEEVDDTLTLILTLPNGESKELHEGTAFCFDQPASFCSIQYDYDLRCRAAPCPIGFYETKEYQCNSDNYSVADFQFGSSCGEIEGEPVYEAVEMCDATYEPVCAITPNIEPCTEIPCSMPVYKTFDNLCEASDRGALVISERECGPLEGIVRDVEQEARACTKEYAPVCAKEQFDIPSLVNIYNTYSNACNAEFAEIAFEGECGDLTELDVLSVAPPIRLVDESPAQQKSVDIDNVRIEKNVLDPEAGGQLTLTLGYSGCEPQYFELYARRYPVRVNPAEYSLTFKPMVNDLCDTFFEMEAQYDLTPLKYRMELEGINEVYFPDLGVTYRLDGVTEE